MDETMKETEELCEKYGWTMECYSPLELRHNDGSFASGQAANLVYLDLQEEERNKKYPTEREHEKAVYLDGFVRGSIEYVIYLEEMCQVKDELIRAQKELLKWELCDKIKKLKQNDNKR